MERVDFAKNVGFTEIELSLIGTHLDFAFCVHEGALIFLVQFDTTLTLWFKLIIRDFPNGLWSDVGDVFFASCDHLVCHLNEKEKKKKEKKNVTVKN